MQLFVGLGNPGAKYARNRHNVGFMALDRIAADHGFSPWRAKFQGEISEGRLGGGKVLLLKPTTFMNNSGQSVQAACRFHKIAPAQITVFHDEIDLAPGKCRLKQGGGHAGHNGLRSVHAHIGADYARVRIGVGHPGRKEAVPGYVLHDFARADEDWLLPLLDGMSDGAPDLARGDGGKFQNRIALRLPPASRPPKASAQGKTSGAGKASATRPAPEPAPEAEQKSALQRLVDKFR